MNKITQVLWAFSDKLVNMIDILEEYIVRNQNSLISVGFTDKRFLNLLQIYEGEFSNITKKKTNTDGFFIPDFEFKKGNEVFLLMIDDLPSGFAVINKQEFENRYEVLEFFILPVCRKAGNGYKTFEEIYKKYKGTWIVKQLPEAVRAKSFWREVISKLTHDNYNETVITDSYWGEVTMQEFLSE